MFFEFYFLSCCCLLFNGFSGGLFLKRVSWWSVRLPPVFLLAACCSFICENHWLGGAAFWKIIFLQIFLLFRLFLLCVSGLTIFVSRRQWACLVVNPLLPVLQPYPYISHLNVSAHLSSRILWPCVFLPSIFSSGV